MGPELHEPLDENCTAIECTVPQKYMLKLLPAPYVDVSDFLFNSSSQQKLLPAVDYKSVHTEIIV